MTVLGFHFVISAYGFWLPNDPRGSWSSTVRQWRLVRFGPATKVSTTRSLANVAHDRTTRTAARSAMKYPPVRFDGPAAGAIGAGLRRASLEAGYSVHALAVLPEHFHLVMGWHDKPIDRIAAHLKVRATGELTRRGLNPMQRFARPDGRMPSPWARNYWCPYITSARQMRIAIRYVQRNPLREGKPVQRWRFVQPFQTR
jgi:hypothetical protein